MKSPLAGTEWERLDTTGVTLLIVGRRQLNVPRRIEDP